MPVPVHPDHVRFQALVACQFCAQVFLCPLAAGDAACREHEAECKKNPDNVFPDIRFGLYTVPDTNVTTSTQHVTSVTATLDPALPFEPVD